MSFPNPDNYARDCSCGTAGANTTPPPATIQAELDTLQTDVTDLQTDVTDLQTTVISVGANRGVLDTGGDLSVPFGGTGGNIYTFGGYGNTGGTLNLTATSSGNGGTIDLSSTSTGANAPHILCGTGVPAVSAPNGSIFLRVNGTASTTLYVRAAGAWSALS